MTMYHNTMSALEKALTVGLIATDLKVNDGMFLDSDDLLKVVKFGTENRYSCVPLCKEVENTEPLYWVTQIAIIDLVNKKLSLKREIKPEDLISVETPIIDVIELLNSRKENPFFLILEKNRITKILTASDLEKLPVRVLVSTLLAHLEGLLQSVIEVQYTQCDSNGVYAWEHFIETRVSAINKLFDNKMTYDRDTKKIQCTSLTDKFEIIRKSDLIKYLNNNQLSNKAMKNKISAIKQIRNRIEHGMPPIGIKIETLRDSISHNNTFTHDLHGLTQVINDIQEWINVFRDYYKS